MDQIVLSVTCAQRAQKAEDKDLLLKQCATICGSSGNCFIANPLLPVASTQQQTWGSSGSSFVPCVCD